MAVMNAAMQMSEAASATPIDTVDDLVAALGGITAAAAALDETEMQVRAWKHRKAISANRFYAHQAILSQHNIAAVPSIWGQVTGGDE